MANSKTRISRLRRRMGNVSRPGVSCDEMHAWLQFVTVKLQLIDQSKCIVTYFYVCMLILHACSFKRYYAPIAVY